jgi:hypothetical protein
MIRSVTRSTISKSVSRVVGGGAAGGEPAPFNPSSIAGLSLWLDAADADTVLNTVSPDVVATDGQTIRRWLDKSGNDLHVNQTTGLNQPLYQTSEVNGRNATEWDGTNDFMQGTFPDCASCTIFQVHKSSKTGAQIWLNGNTAARYGTITQSGSSSTNISEGFGTPTFRANGAAASWSTRGEAYTTIVTGSPIVFVTIAADTSLWASNVFYLGYQSLVSFGPGGNICELLIYDGVLSAENIASVESYLATKWGVTLA